MIRWRTLTAHEAEHDGYKGILGAVKMQEGERQDRAQLAVLEFWDHSTGEWVRVPVEL